MSNKIALQVVRNNSRVIIPMSEKVFDRFERIAANNDLSFSSYLQQIIHDHIVKYRWESKEPLHVYDWITR